MHIINDTELIQLNTSTAEQIDWSASYVDISGSSTSPLTASGSITTATDTGIVGTPASGVGRHVKSITIRNSGTGTNVVTLQRAGGATINITPAITLAPGEMLEVADSTRVFDRAGRVKANSTEQVGYGGFPIEFYKVGTASEAAGVRYAYLKDSGLPGAWVPGTPGVNGWWTDASTQSNAANPAGATQTGAPRLANPASGSLYLQDIGITTSVAHLVQLHDLLWYNTGLVVTTTTAQTISMPATAPARDKYGTVNGEGWQAAIYVTTATTNAGVITNTTLSYTNSEGTSGRTATISSFPATAVAGTLVPFQLAAGDSGIQSIQSVTLGTTYGGGAISLVLYRTLASVPNPLANVGGIMNKLTSDPTGIRIYNGTSLFWSYVSSTTTATSLAGTVNIVER